MSTLPSCTPMPNSTTDETTEEDEVGRIQDDLIDLEPVRPGRGGARAAGQPDLPTRTAAGSARTAAYRGTTCRPTTGTP